MASCDSHLGVHWVSTRMALLKERESKVEMLGEAERASYAAQEKMRKQMETIVAETEARMTKTIELQLHAVIFFTVLPLGSFSCTSH